MENEQIETLQKLYQKEIIGSVRLKITDTMVAYGAEAIPYLVECANGELLAANREYILTKIKELKKG